MNTWHPHSENELTGKALRKYRNKKRILRQLYLKHELASADLSKKLGLSIPTIQSLLGELAGAGLVKESGLGHSRGGRRPSLYAIADQAIYALGIDVDRQSARIAIFNHLNENMTGTRTLNLSVEMGDALIPRLYQAVQALVAEQGIDYQRLIGVGITMPGLVDSERGINHTYLQGEPSLAQRISKQFQLPAYIENDAKARALAEYRFGWAKGEKNVLALHLNWGLGLGMILDGKLYKGHSGFAGEFSHIPMENNQLACHCGKTGCLETIASGRALVRIVNEGLEMGGGHILRKLMEESDELTPELIVQAAQQGDELSLDAISQVGNDLGRGLAILIQIINPGLIIIGGTMAQAGEYLITPIRQSLFLNSLPKLRETVAFKISNLQHHAGVLGAAAVVMENSFT